MRKRISRNEISTVKIIGKNYFYDFRISLYLFFDNTWRIENFFLLFVEGENKSKWNFNGGKNYFYDFRI